MRSGARRDSPVAARLFHSGVAAVAVLAVALTVLSYFGLRNGVFNGFRLAAADSLYPSETTDPRIVVVAIDSRSILQQAQPWPWGRDVQAALVDRLAQAGPRLIALDLVYHPETPTDAVFADAAHRAGNVVVAAAAELDRPRHGTVLDARSLTMPVDSIARSVAGVGLANVTPDPADGVVRSLPLVVQEADGRLLPSLSLASLIQIENLPSVLTVRPGGVQVGDRLVPTEDLHLLDVNYAAALTLGTRDAPVVSAGDVLAGRVPADEFRDAVVLVGVTDPTLGDHYLTPVDKRSGEPGVVIQANALNTMLTNGYLSDVGRTETLAWVFGLAMLAGLATRYLRIWLAALIVVLAVAAYILVAFVRFDAGHVMDLVYPPAALGLAFVAALGVRLAAVAAQRRRMARLLSQYVPPTMADLLLARGGGGLPTGEVTFLLTDVVGSTAAWEAEPRAMGLAMRRHDVLIDDAVLTHGGAMVRPRGEGDSRFAVFLRPEDAAAAAVEINRAFEHEHWGTSSPVRVRTAIHTGEAELREGDYYGSVVNRCARIRSTADPGQILLSAATADRVGGSLADGARLRPLGARPLKDIAEPEDVWELAP